MIEKFGVVLSPAVVQSALFKKTRNELAIYREIVAGHINAYTTQPVNNHYPQKDPFLKLLKHSDPTEAEKRRVAFALEDVPLKYNKFIIKFLHAAIAAARIQRTECHLIASEDRFLEVSDHIRGINVVILRPNQFNFGYEYAERLDGESDPNDSV